MEDGGSQWKIGLSIVFLGVTGILLIGITMLFIDSSSSWNENNSTCLLNKTNICENVTKPLKVSRSSYF